MIGPARKRHAQMKAAAAIELTQLEVEAGATNAARLQLSPLDASSYILSMVTELRALAKAANFRFLTYLLEIAFQEAFRLTGDLEQAQARQRQSWNPSDSEPKP